MEKEGKLGIVEERSSLSRKMTSEIPFVNTSTSRTVPATVNPTIGHQSSDENSSTSLPNSTTVIPTIGHQSSDENTSTSLLKRTTGTPITDSEKTIDARKFLPKRKAPEPSDISSPFKRTKKLSAQSSEIDTSENVFDNTDDSLIKPPEAQSVVGQFGDRRMSQESEESSENREQGSVVDAEVEKTISESR